MQLIVYESEGQALRAGYECACGCRPSQTYQRGAQIETHDCCCGNQFALGPGAERHVSARDGFHLETTAVEAPWGESLTAAWMVGSSVHPPAGDGGAHGHGHAHDHDHGSGSHGSTQPATVVDPVCGMSVDPPVALEKGLHSRYKDTDYFFCGKGCKLDFDEDPERYLDPAYIPSM